MPKAENAAIYTQYKKLADQTKDAYFAGRQASYKYYNMEQVVAHALTLFKKTEEKPLVLDGVAVRNGNGKGTLVASTLNNGINGADKSSDSNYKDN